MKNRLTPRTKGKGELKVNLVYGLKAMQHRQRIMRTRAEDGSACAVRLPWALILKVALLLLLFGLPVYAIVSCQLCTQQLYLEPTGGDIAELHLNHTGPRQDPRLHWQGGPALGRSFLHGPQLDNGQLRVQRDGIYRLHIQVTLTNCSSSSENIVSRRAVLTVGICSPATRSISLLRLNFHLSCTVASQRLTPLSQGDTLCTNLTLPLQPSPNADETFFGVQWVHS
ncbi:CD70 antigen [Pteronotus mesoamericanus]|uniref:CD70 antigen n=1 Tax=Pteronotus mesoamericanus TaxID=1884717 RepID=UPI0023ED529B|nr:CD70 antigen [Pteronotus parnellii mesoamericanus]